MRKPMDYNVLVEDYRKRFGVDNPGRQVKVLHIEEIDELNTHPSDEELKRRRMHGDNVICVACV